MGYQPMVSTEEPWAGSPCDGFISCRPFQMKLDSSLTPADLAKPAARVGELAAQKVKLIADAWDSARGTPVFTVEGKYTTRGWTEWTQGFQYGSALLAFD